MEAYFPLGSTDAAGKVSHQCPTQGAAIDATAHASVLCLSFLFSFFWIHTDSASIHADSARIRSFWPAIEIVEKRPKSLEQHHG